LSETLVSFPTFLTVLLAPDLASSTTIHLNRRRALLPLFGGGAVKIER